MTFKSFCDFVIFTSNKQKNDKKIVTVCLNFFTTLFPHFKITNTREKNYIPPSTTISMSRKLLDFRIGFVDIRPSRLPIQKNHEYQDPISTLTEEENKRAYKSETERNYNPKKSN